jgi:hypothetical protein
MNNTTLNTSENSPQETDDETTNLKQRQPSSSIFNDASTTEIKFYENTQKPKARQRKKRVEPVLSIDSKQRAKFLLEMLTQSIENRSKSNHTHPHSSYPGIQHYKTDQHLSQRSSNSSPDPFTNRFPPKAQRRSPSLNKNPNQNDHTITNDTS